ncbi:uncharacterized protein BDZ99DRAFT_552445 [Mytilinidion resinicola]|uniref:Uncharacterized protein n=1 Tax=Mytilinidion resinicola TaxID=574789 RepID=A0A6A6Y0N0_9PEZI|nr:uncharacterized protein BDZ99DRAFT_552445 [Mytilinidion resinicola]KAF2801785.1 hypothetical protein BDZ99DRAFT_552445 [Mytilinidion resinicola]
MLARTKLRAYNLFCSSFVDFVEDDKCCNNPSSPAPCLRLRIGSRRPALGDCFRYAPITMWPAPANACPCAARLHDILNPPFPAGSAYGNTLVGVVDERSLVYMLRPERLYGDDDPGGLIILISFDWAIGRVRAGDEGVGNGVDSAMGDRRSEIQMLSIWVAGKAEACRDGTCC